MKLRVYLVEDSPIMSKLLLDLIGSEKGIIVAGYADAAATAIDEIRELRPDVIVVDIALRQRTGLEVLDAIKEDAIRSPVRIILTNYALKVYRDAAARLGAEYFFEKANQIHELLVLLGAMAQTAKKANGAPT